MKHLSIVLIACLLFSCSKPSGSVNTDLSALEEIIIDPQNGEKLSLDSLIENVEFIKLESLDENLIGKISQILFSDNLLFIVDSESTKSINIFDLKGNFIHRIHHVGNGPEEYVDISNVCIVPHKNELAILDRAQRRTLYYNFSGKYVSTEQIPFINNYYEYLESGNKAFEIYGMKDSVLGNDKDNSLVVTDSVHNVIYSFFKDIYRRNFYYTKNKTIRKFDKEIYYSPNITDTIYCVKDSLITAKYFINITQNNATDIEITNTEQFHKILESHYFFNGDFIELKDFTYINIMSPWGYPSAVYVHSNRKTFLNTGVGNHPFFTFMNSAPKARYGDNCIVFDVQSYQILAQKTRLYQSSDYKQELDQLFENLTEDSNPVLFLFHFNSNFNQ